MKLINKIAAVYLFSFVVIISYSTATAKPSNWPQWRGPDGRGVSEEKGLPAEWTSTRNVKWKTPISGRGHSSPIIWGKKIFLITWWTGEPFPVELLVGRKKRWLGVKFVNLAAVAQIRKLLFNQVCLDGLKVK